MSLNMGVQVRRVAVGVREQGAIAWEGCPTRRRKNWMCECEPCHVCGFGPHTVIHGPAYGKEPGSKPWGHEYRPADPFAPTQGRDHE